jgi:VanZ family protein
MPETGGVVTDLNASDRPIPLFTSDRERRLWFWAVAVVVAIYCTLGLAGTLGEALRERYPVDDMFFISFLVLVAAILGSGLLRRPGRLQIWVELGVIAVYAMVVLRMATDPAHRTHLFEYGLVAVLVYHALAERRRGGGRVRAAAALALGITVLLGSLDEGIQWIVPNRVFDIVDVGFNALAGLMAITASVALAWARRRVGVPLFRRVRRGRTNGNDRTAPEKQDVDNDRQ